MACSSSCRTQNHASYGECMRAKSIRLQDVTFTELNRKQTTELNAYADARRQGIQPKSTRKPHTDAAVRISNETGTAYRADE